MHASMRERNRNQLEKDRHRYMLKRLAVSLCKLEGHDPYELTFRGQAVWAKWKFYKEEASRRLKALGWPEDLP